MSTNSRIAVLQPDGRVKSVYCHSDGYLSYMGNMLLNYYNSFDKADNIVALGDISVLSKNLKPLPFAPEAYFRGEGSPRMIKANEHSFDNRQKDITVAYCRDRGEDFNQKHFKSLADYNENEDFESYNYLYKNDKWYWFNRGKWVVLTQRLIDNAKD